MSTRLTDYDISRIKKKLNVVTLTEFCDIYYGITGYKIYESTIGNALSTTGYLSKEYSAKISILEQYIDAIKDMTETQVINLRLHPTIERVFLNDF